jgi:RHS repeat-associated protein
MQFEYVYYLGQRILKVTPGVNGTAYLYFSDGIGSARTVTNVNGGICEDSDYLPFGQEIAYTNTCPQNYKFTGMERDAETGNDHTLHRQYAWNHGRWLSPDPVAGGITNPQSLPSTLLREAEQSRSLNRYGYLLNNLANLGASPGIPP